MGRATLLGCCFLALWPALAPAADSTLSAQQIADRNVTARGGLAAWRAVKAMTWTGRMDAGGNNRPTLAMPAPHSKTAMPPARPQEQAQLPFVLDMERPHKSRMEIQFKGQTAVQVFDGSQGWKLRPYLNRHEIEPFSPEELKISAAQTELDGPLIDYAAKGTTVALAGRETVDGQDAYKLTLTFKDKRTEHVWVDAKTFLEIKLEGTPRRLDGKNPVWVYLRDYKTVAGLVMPMVYETVVQGVATSEKIMIDKVAVNPALTGARFAKLQ